MTFILAGIVNLRLRWERWPNRWLVAAGDVSYSIYPLHYFVFYLAAVTAKLIFARFPALQQDWLCEPWRWAALILSCFIASFTWKFIESPMIALGNVIASKFSIKRAPIPLPLVGP
jgi:peptidoglycan/LPS O-acetylase OafA/YrhL